jgi:hypothetical protein
MRYRAAREAERADSIPAVEREAATVGSTKADYLKSKQNAAEERKKRNRLAKLRELIPAAEGELDELDALMSGEASTDYKRLAELDARKSELEERLMEMYEEMEELEAWEADRA